MALAGKIAIVTGGTGGLGRVVVRGLLDAEATVLIPHREKEGEDPVLRGLQSLSPRIIAYAADLTVEGEVERFIDSVLARAGRIDILVHAAGAYAGGDRVEETPAAVWDRMMALNLRTAFLVCRGVLPSMRKQGFGRIITIGAMPAVRPSPNRAAYAVSKRGVITLTEVIAEEVKGTGITANVIAPGTILTDANREPGADTSAWVTPQEITRLILHLCSDDARLINGTTIRMFG
jgi:NAD(P)-dependent dehydrogenase (short-subunit alcohol dehydrogenase family)